MSKTQTTDPLRAQLEAAATKGGDPAAKSAASSDARETEQGRRGALRSRGADDTERLERAQLNYWAPPSTLQLPPDDHQFVYRWIAEYVNGAARPNRLSKARQEGYQFVRIDELPEDFFVDEDVKGDGLARNGGLIMARLPRAFAEQRKQYYARRSAAALDGANQLQGIAGKNTVEENRGTRSLDGRAAGDALRSMARS